MSGSLSGGCIRIQWDAPDAAYVTITGGSAAFTVGGVAVTFPYELEATTSFVTANPGDYTVSVTHHGVEVASTPDGTRAVSLRFGESITIAPSPDGTSASVLSALGKNFDKRAKLSSWPIFAYGHSNAVLSAGWVTSGLHYLQQARDALGAGTLTSYAVSGQRALHAVCSLHTGVAVSGVANPAANSLWPGTSNRNGLVVVDIIANDIGHYPSMSVSPVVPATITSANTQYLDGLTGMYRAILALASSESRVESTAGTYGGTWTNTAFTSTAASGGSFAFTSTVGATADFTVTPAQTGPLAGKVYAIINKFSTNLVAAGMATINVSVDGGSATPFAVTPWERHVGVSSINVDAVFDCIPITVPVDGASHTVRLAHAGSASQRMDIDCILVPSADPNPIAFMGHERMPEVHASYFNAAGVNAFQYNAPLVVAKAKAVVAEFPNAFYVTSTMTSNGLYSGDKIHPNDRGMTQRANDLVAAAQSIKPRLVNRALAIAPDAGFGIV